MEQLLEKQDNEVKLFENSEFGSIRTIMIDDNPWFVGKDVAVALGYANIRKAVPDHVDEEDKLRTQIRYAGQNREMTIINESGVYALIFGSKLPSAKRFKQVIQIFNQSYSIDIKNYFLKIIVDFCLWVLYNLFVPTRKEVKNIGYS